MNSATHDDAATVDRAQCRWHQRADWRENNGRIEFLRRCFIRSARPDGAETDREFPRLRISRARESENVPALMPRDLGHDVRRRAKAVKAESLRISRFAERAVADQPRAEQRRCAHIIVAVRNSKTETRIGRDVLGIAAVDRVAAEARPPAEILAARAAEIAFAAGPSEPRNADAFADPKTSDAFTEFFDVSDDFVSWNQRQLRIRQLTVDNVQIGAANRARRHAHEHFARAWMRNR